VADSFATIITGIRRCGKSTLLLHVMDLGIYTESAVSTSDNTGRRLENLVFLHLRRKCKYIFYYKDRGECDFITMEKKIR
jgi:predicted AAA+ superfamily ATPase